MVALWQTVIFCPVVSSFFFFFPCLISASQIGCLSYFNTWCGLIANFRCRSETCCTPRRLPGNAGRKKVAKNRNLGTIAQLCRAISSQLRHVSTIGKNTSSRCPPQYGELRPASGWDRSGSLGHPSQFQPLSRLDSLTARQSSSGRQPNFRRLTEGTTYVRQGDHRVGHWPTF